MSKILVAEDEPALLESYKEVIESLGHECLQAIDGVQAIELARESHPDLIVTDYMMPRGTGLDVLRALHDDPRLRDVPTVLMTAARPSEEQRRQAWRFLFKPVSLEEFERAVQDGLSAARARRPSDEPHVADSGRPSELSLAREDMLSWVSHEIKSPLAAAAMATQLALRKVRSHETGASVERHLVIAARQLARMDELANSILDAAQLRDGRLRLELEPIGLGDWLKKIVAFWRDLHPEHELSFHDGQELTVVGDPERLRQIVDNLISNAIKYARPAKRVRIDVETTDDEIQIHVEDAGPGIPAAEIPKLFDRFHRVAGQGGRGHGLGLYIANALARLHGGRLSVTSELGHGSRFTLSLPRGQAC
jgi:two-component system sensor histidine kinase/response regulator